MMLIYPEKGLTLIPNKNLMQFFSQHLTEIKYNYKVTSSLWIN